MVNAAAFTNDHWQGRYIYGAAAIVAGVGSLYVTLNSLPALQLPYAAHLGVVVIVLGLATTWLRGLGILYR